MQLSANSGDQQQPEKLIGYLAARIRRHVFWDSLLIFVPIALALIYTALFLYRAAWVSGAVFLVVAAAGAGLGFLAVVLRSRPRRPNLMSTARLADERSGAKDHFLTLSTIDPASCAPALVSRLRRDASGFGKRVDLKRDFPYRLKRSSYLSLLASLFLAALIHFAAPLAGPSVGSAPMLQRLRELAQQMAERPSLQEIAKELEALAARLEDPKVSEEEKKALVQEMEKKLEEQQKKEEREDQRDLLAQAANTLEGAEQQQSAAGKDQQKDQQKGAGAIEGNLPQDGEGESKQSAGGSGESKGERSAQLSQDIQQGKSAQGSPKDPGPDKNQKGQGDAKNDQPDPNRREKDQKNEQTTKDQGGSKDGAGRNQASEEPPQGAPPEDRLYKAGEGKEGIKGARYVTVQLPEEVAAETKGESMVTKESKGARVSAKIPVSNVPLPAHVPNAPMEKQQLPIEYRGMIR
jgi:hypothetical protein